MVELAPEVEGYFSAFDQALKGLAEVAQTESEKEPQSAVLYEELLRQLSRLEHSFACWQLKCHFSGSFKFDRRESGFPPFKSVMELQHDMVEGEENRFDLPSQEQIREEMIELLLKFKQFPSDLQRTMAERVYFDKLAARDVFSAYTSPRTLLHTINERTGRPYYIVTWSVYDGVANMPMLYTLMMEDSSDEASARPRRKPKGGRSRDWLSNLHHDGLPNLMLRADFREFTQNHSSYSLNLTTIATALDETFYHLHPKQLRRFVLGPFYAGGLTDHNEKVQSVLDDVKDHRENWLLTWTVQELHSKEEIPEKKGIFSGTQAKEIFYVNTDDVDCAAQGVSAIERYALVPHTAYQAAFAKGLAEEIFNDYRCYIASGEHILRHV